MNAFIANVLLALAWMLLYGEFSPLNFAFGFILGYVVLTVAGGPFKAAGYLRRVRTVISFLLYFAWQLVLANMRVAYYVLVPGHRMRPAIVAVPIELQSDVEISLLANLITLTPGTLTLDVSDNRRVMYVHTVYIDDVDAFRKEIKDGFERRVRELFR